MKQIGFYQEYVEPIKEGIKTSTIRKNFNGKPGEIFSAYNADNCKFNIQMMPKNPFGNLNITSIKYIRFDEINEEIARTEGYLHENLLKETLYGIYDDELEDSTLLYYIQFEFIPLEDDDNESVE